MEEQEIIQDTNLQLPTIAELSNETIINVTNKGIITGWNLTAEQTFGYTKQQAIGEHISMIVPEDKTAEEEDIHHRLSGNQSIPQFETVTLTKDKRRIPFSVSILPIKNSRGEIIGSSRIGRDITQQRLVEERNAILAAIVNSSDDAIISKNLQGYITSWNRGAEQIFQYRQEEMIGKHITAIIPEDLWYEEETIISKVRSGERIEHYETIRKRKDGELLHVSLTVSPVRNANNEIIGISKIARNITDQKVASEKVARLAAIVDSSDDAIVSKTLHGVITSWNKSAERIFGYAASEAIGKHITLIIPQRLRQEEDMIISRVKSGRKVEPFETKRVRKDGSEVDLSITVSPVRNESGDIIGASKIARDITDTVKSRRQLELYAEELKKLNRHKNDFISIASHELNTPLTSLKVYLDMLKMNMEAEENKPKVPLSYVERAISLNGKLIKLVNDLLDVSRIESGKLELRIDRFDCTQLVHDIIDNMKVTSRKHRIAYEGIDEPAYIAGDRDRLEQVFVNLLSNAIKYSPEADIIKVGVKKDSSHIQVSVQDFGIGIPATESSQIFSRFYRAEGKARTFSGLGIGLYVSSELVKGHKGTLAFSSQEEEGSVFTVTLPLFSS